MSEQDYLLFHQCRLANLVSRGKHVLCQWLDLNVELLPKKDLEVFAYALRVVLTQIVEQAIRARDVTSK